MEQQVLAAIGLALCLGVWTGMALGPARRARLRAWLHHGWRDLGTQRRARREAADAIERARRRKAVDRDADGKVLRPKSFQRRDKDDTLH